jgi:hypothetical protein
MTGFSAKWRPTDHLGSQQEAEALALKRWDLTMRKYGLAAADHGFLYRLRDEDGGDDWMDTVRVRLDAYPILKITKAGCIIPLDKNRYNTSSREYRFISNESGKPWAAKTVERALTGFKYRKLNQANIFRSKMERALSALQKAFPEIGKADRTEFYGSDF